MYGGVAFFNSVQAIFPHNGSLGFLDLLRAICLSKNRHGESTWNFENRFTGWKDVPLSEKGKVEAAQCGDLIAESGLTFDVAYTSVLKVGWVPLLAARSLERRKSCHHGRLKCVSIDYGRCLQP